MKRKRNLTRWPGFCALLAVVAACHAEFRVNTYTTDDQQYPAIAGNGSGNFVIVWECDGQNGVYGQRCAANGAFLGNEFRIGSGGEPDVAMDAAGNFVVAWQDGDGSNEGIYARLYDANGQPLTGEFPVNTHTDSRQIRPGVAMNNTGEFVITWESWHDPGHHCYTTGRKYNANGVPYGPEFLITQVTHGHRPDVVIDDSGDFVVAWLRSGDLDDPPDGDFIKFRLYKADGTAKGDAVQITDYVAPYNYPSIGMDGSGNFVITWVEILDSYDISARRFDANGNAIAERFIVNTYRPEAQLRSSVAVANDGRFVVVWHGPGDGSDRTVLGQKYAGDGTAVGDEFQINTHITGHQWLAQAAIRDDGKFVTVWQSEGQDGDGYGIYGELGEFPERIITVDDDGPADFNSIQPAIDFSSSGDTIIVRPGLYDEDINFLGKNITLRSADPGDTNVVATTIIHGGVAFEGAEGPNCMLAGFKIDRDITGFDPLIDPNGENHTHATINHCVLQGNGTCGGTVIRACDGKISNCIIADNFTICVSVMPVVSECHGTIESCTIANNNSSVEVEGGGSTTIRNCIIYHNWEFMWPPIIVRGGATLDISYCDVQNGLEAIYLEDSNCAVNWGPGNIATDPCFVRVGYWDDELYQPFEGDYHLQSQGGRWDPNEGRWAIDEVTSPCIDAGGPMSPLGPEPFPNGGTINMGAYGGTVEASKSYFGKPPCEIVVAGDVNGDCVIDFEDFRLMALHWCADNNP
ncbi:MAG: right-handed parallel beta-helix repeat-containing protein [Planctomycetota bacterium]|jgi:hypothetical protein